MFKSARHIYFTKAERRKAPMGSASVMQCTELPKTVNGKIMRVAIRQADEKKEQA